MKRLQHLSFVIGLFFLLAGLVLLANEYLTDNSADINRRSGWTYLVFALLMMFLKLPDVKKAGK